MKALLIYSCLFCFDAAAQELPANTQQQLENLADENLEDDALLQSLAYFRSHPLNLNTATAEELQSLRLLNSLQIDALLRYRAALGSFVDVYELQAVPGFDVLLLRKLRPFVFAGSAEGLKETLLSRLKGGDRYVLFRWSRVLEKAKGYDAAKATHYLGDPNRLLLTYRYQYKTSLYYGFTADKDAGEPFLRKAQKSGFDFYSAHVFARNLGPAKALALGDYAVNLGQGLTQWQSLAFGKSAEVLGIKRQSPVLQPYRSAGEFLFNRGAALTLGFQKWEATAFVSYKKFSGNLEDDSVRRFTSFNTSGYYRTVAEAEERYRLTDFSWGGNLSFAHKGFHLGLNAVAHRFSRPLQKRNEPYNYYAFSGRQLFNGSFDYSFTWRNAHFFGEVAVDKNLYRAMLYGVLVSLDSRVDLSLLYRNFSAGYQAIFGNALSENSLPSNEQGVYAGVVVRPATGWQLTAYADVYRFPFLKYRVSSPSRGADYLVHLTWQPSRQTEAYLRFRSEGKPLNESGSAATIDQLIDQRKRNLRFQFSRQLSPLFSLRSRAELTWFERAGKGEEGFLGYVEAARSLSTKLEANARLQWFETGGYDSRIYAYESDVLYGFSIPAFFDKGLRYYFNLRFQATKELGVWFRFSQTVYSNKTETGSGLDLIEGPRKTEIRLQARYNF